MVGFCTSPISSSVTSHRWFEISHGGEYLHDENWQATQNGLFSPESRSLNTYQHTSVWLIFSLILDSWAGPSSTQPAETTLQVELGENKGQMRHYHSEENPETLQSYLKSWPTFPVRLTRIYLPQSLVCLHTTTSLLLAGLVQGTSSAGVSKTVSFHLPLPHSSPFSLSGIHTSSGHSHLPSFLKYPMSGFTDSKAFRDHTVIMDMVGRVTTVLLKRGRCSLLSSAATAQSWLIGQWVGQAQLSSDFSREIKNWISLGKNSLTLK